MSEREEEEDLEDTPVPPDSHEPVEPEQPVYQRQFKEVLDHMSKVMTDSIQNAIAQMEVNVSRKINANTAEVSKALNEYRNTLNDHATAINALAQGGGNAAAASQGGSGNMVQTFLQLLEHPLVKAKLGLQEDPIAGELSNLSEIIAIGAKREVAAAMKTGIRRYLKQGHLYASEARDVITDSAASRVEHGI